MPATLKNKYAAKNLDAINEAAKAVLLEELDRQTMDAAISAIKKLQNIDFSSIPSLSDARDAVLVDITNLISGEDKRSLLQKIAGAFGKENGPIYSALAFGSAVRQFFSTFSSFIDALATKNGVAGDEKTRLVDIGNDKLHASIRKFVYTNFKPRGQIFQKFGSDWKKYLGGDLDPIVDDIMLLNIGQLKRLGSTVKQATANVDGAAAGAEGQGTAAQPTASPADATLEKIKGKLQPSELNTARNVINALASIGALK